MDMSKGDMHNTFNTSDQIWHRIARSHLKWNYPMCLNYAMVRKWLQRIMFSGSQTSKDIMFWLELNLTQKHELVG